MSRLRASGSVEEEGEMIRWLIDLFRWRMEGFVI